ncbi:MAG TPA: hypothetical protein VF228_21095 [Iamia sp.]
MRYRPLLAGAAALALALSLTACGDDGDDTADTADTADTSAETEDTATEDTATDDTEAETEDTTDDTEAETEDTTEDTEADTPGDLTGLLVTAEDVGEGFAEQPYETSTEPGPCGTAIDEDYPYDAIVGTVLAHEELGLGLQHELRTYADEETAATTFTAAQDALACGDQTTEPGVVLGEVTDTTAEVGADAFVVTVTAEEDGVEGGIVVVQVGQVLSVYQFQGPVEVTEGPDPLAIVTANVESLQTELG